METFIINLRFLKQFQATFFFCKNFCYSFTFLTKNTDQLQSAPNLVEPVVLATNQLIEFEQIQAIYIEENITNMNIFVKYNKLNITNI